MFDQESQIKRFHQVYLVNIQNGENGEKNSCRIKKKITKVKSKAELSTINNQIVKLKLHRFTPISIGFSQQNLWNRFVHARNDV
jgi:hypothetical protein